MDTGIYKLGKELDSFNYQEVQNSLLAILEKGCSATLDMTDCTYISSTGLRVLLYTKKMAKAKGLNFSLKGVGDEVKDIMTITGFDGFFDYE